MISNQGHQSTSRDFAELLTVKVDILLKFTYNAKYSFHCFSSVCLETAKL